jgi:hypothetical protein
MLQRALVAVVVEYEAVQALWHGLARTDDWVQTIDSD